MSNFSQTAPAGACYKFTVNSAEQAVTLIREQLGPAARVLSVRSVAAAGWRRWVRGSQLEVIAQLDPVTPEPAPAFVAVSDEAALPAVEAMRAEVKTHSGLAPAPIGLAALLRRSGLTESAVGRLQATASWNDWNTMPLHRALADTARHLRQQADARPVRSPISRAAFLGTPGVGRTTALCKWLAVEVFRRARLGHVVTVEFDRPNSTGPLSVFSEALGLPLAHFPCETRPAVPGGFVYFDLPGLSLRRPADNAALATWLEQEQITERVLVLNAAYDRAALRDAHAAGRDLGATHLVFTHLDEVSQWGRLWDYLFDESLEPLFISTGPSLTGDCEDDVPGAIMRRTLPGEAS